MMRKKILVIEDAEVIRDSLRELLEQEGYAVECAENGDVGIQTLRLSEPLPGLILLDLTMPVKDGFQFREEQKQDPRLADVPVIVMTADVNIVAKALKVGGKGYLKKPFDIDQVVKVVREHCL